MSGADLGTYHVKVEFQNARGFIMRWDTGVRYSGGTHGWSPIDANPLPFHYESEEELRENILYAFDEGNYGCDCNRALFIARAYQEEDPELWCGETILLERMTLIKPDLSEEVIYEQHKG